ncbi:V-type proton ATPase subunit cprimeprime2 [Diplonema papillatum]|nr:V-type proton ATPase subunit cprimeprime2 [Diplonema papillatum]
MGMMASLMNTVRDPDLDRIESDPTTRAARMEPDMAMGVLNAIFGWMWYIVFFLFVFLPLIISGQLTVWPNWAYFWQLLANVSPYSFAGVGMGISITFSIIGAAWGILISGSSISGAAIRTPRMVSRNLISIIFCEAVGIYGLIIALLMNNKMKMEGDHFLPPSADVALPADGLKFGIAQSLYTLFAAGLTVAIGNFACGIAVGLVGSACAIADAADRDLFVQILIIEIFASVLGIFTLIVGILQSNEADFSTASFGKA